MFQNFRNILICVTLALTLLLGACAPSLPSGDAPAAPSAMPPSAVNTLLPTAMPQPEPQNTYTGEWAGYLINGQDTTESARVYTIKFTLTENGGWLSLDSLEGYHLPSFQPPSNQAGAPVYWGEEGDTLTLRLGEWAYHTAQEPPLPSDAVFVLTYHDMQEEEQAVYSEYAPSGWRGYSGDLLLGEVRVGGEVLYTVSLASLSEGLGLYPQWENEYAAFAPNICGAYTFGETGADNSNSTHIFVYQDETGRERIRYFFGWLAGVYRQGDAGAFIVTDFDFSIESYLSIAQVPMWDTLCTLDTATGTFVDASRMLASYYRETYIPRYEWALAELLLDQEMDEEEDEWDKQDRQREINANTGVLLRAYEIVTGKRPDALPALPEIKPNAPALYIDLDGDGNLNIVEACFTNIFNEQIQPYNGCKLRINGKWSYTIVPGASIEPVLYAVDIAREEAGNQIALACTGTDGVPFVLLYDILIDGNSIAYLCNIPVMGTLPANTGQCGVCIPGDGTIEGRMRSSLLPELVLRIPYTMQYEFINRVEQEALQAVDPLEIRLAKPLCVYTAIDGIEAATLEAGQALHILASDEQAWLQAKTQAGQIGWVRAEDVVL